MRQEKKKRGSDGAVWWALEVRGAHNPHVDPSTPAPRLAAIHSLSSETSGKRLPFCVICFHYSRTGVSVLSDKGVVKHAVCRL